MAVMLHSLTMARTWLRTTLMTRKLSSALGKVLCIATLISIWDMMIRCIGLFIHRRTARRN